MNGIHSLQVHMPPQQMMAAPASMPMLPQYHGQLPVGYGQPHPMAPQLMPDGGVYYPPQTHDQGHFRSYSVPAIQPMVCHK
jgi:hypothetical protein